MSEKFLTTASALGSFRKELIEQGFSESEAFEMARDVATNLVHEGGLAVRDV